MREGEGANRTEEKKYVHYILKLRIFEIFILQFSFCNFHFAIFILQFSFFILNYKGLPGGRETLYCKKVKKDCRKGKGSIPSKSLYLKGYKFIDILEETEF